MAAAAILRDGGVMAVPTDTVYGLSASVYQPEAIARIYELKQRPPEKRVPVLLATAADLPLLVSEVTDLAWDLIREFWPGRLTLVLPARSSAPRILVQGGGTVAVRVPGARSTLELLQALGEPIVGTSANVSGMPPALTAAEVVSTLPGVDAVLADDKVIAAQVSSTVVEVGPRGVDVLRIGAVPLSEIQRVAGSRITVQRLAPPPGSG